MKQQRIHVPKHQIASFCRRHHIRRLSLFGSVLRGDFGGESDVHVLVEFEQGHVPGFIASTSMENELSDLFGGRKVDLRTPQDLSRYFRNEVISQAQIQYEQS